MLMVAQLLKKLNAFMELSGVLLCSCVHLPVCEYRLNNQKHAIDRKILQRVCFQVYYQKLWKLTTKNVHVWQVMNITLPQRMEIQKIKEINEINRMAETD